MQRDSVGSTFVVAAVLCVVCSVVVSGLAVGLRPKQEAEKAKYRKVNILQAAGKYDDTVPVDDQFSPEVVETRLIDFATGKVVEEGMVDPATYDQRVASKVPSQSIEIEKDIAGIKRRAKYGRVYIFRDDAGKVSQVVLPVYGKGLWSTMYGFLAVEGDLATSAGLTFYEHGETPGLGGEIESEKFKAAWRSGVEGKENLMLFDDDGDVAVEVVKGTAGDPKYQVDGLSGATITSRGVSQLVRYWLSDDGYGPFLKELKAEMDGGSNG